MIAEWSAGQISLRNESAPIRDLMKFYLVYSGPLPSSGNKAKPNDVLAIRRQLSPQLKYLWETSHALKELSEQAWLPNPASRTGFSSPLIPGGIPTPGMRGRSTPGSMIDLCSSIEVGQKKYRPLVRSSLHLNCKLEILFLRQDDPGQLIRQGGDLDGRMKALLDGLRMPSIDEQDRAYPEEDEMHCLLEDDSLVAAVDIDTERLLFPNSTHPHQVHLVIGVSMRVLRVVPFNTCLL